MTPSLRISIIIPVLNEAANINELINRLRSLPSDAELEIIVVDGDPAGSTIAAITPGAVRTALSPPGRAAQMNTGASLAGGDILLFLHADTFLPGNAIPLIRTVLSDNTIVGGAFRLGIDSPRWYFRITERYVALRTRITRVPFGDQAIFIKKAYFEKIGRYRDIPVMEDVELMTRIRESGDAIAIAPAQALTSSRRWEKEGLWYGTVRNMLLQTLYCCGVPPRRLSRFYR